VELHAVSVEILFTFKIAYTETAVSFANTMNVLLFYLILKWPPPVTTPMAELSLFLGLPSRAKKKPLQTGKFIGVLLALTLAVTGFFRIIDARAIIQGPMLGDGQFLALVLLPPVSLVLVVVVFIETLVSGYRSLRSDQSLSDQVSGSVGYLALRGAEAGFAILGVATMGTAVPALIAESTPAPVGIGIMLLLFGVGFGILFVSLVRSTAELFVYDASP